MKSLFGKENVELDGAAVAKKRDELTSARGRKSTDRPEQIRILQYLLDLANGANLGMGEERREREREGKGEDLEREGEDFMRLYALVLCGLIKWVWFQVQV